MPPLVLITGAFALGIAIAQLLAGSSWVLAALGAAVLLLTGGIWAYLQGKRGSFLWVILCFLCLGYAWLGLCKTPFPQSLEPFLNHYVKIEGVVEALPSSYPNRVVFVIDKPVIVLGQEKWQGRGKVQVVYYAQAEPADKTAYEQKATGTFRESGSAVGVPGLGTSGASERITLITDSTGSSTLSGPGTQGNTAASAGMGAELLPGAVVSVEGLLELPPTALSSGEFDYRAYLERRGILTQLKAQGSPQIRVPGKGLRCFWASLRLRMETGINNSLPREDALFLQGIMLGSKEGMTLEDRDIYQRTGVMHLFAVSGLHLGFVFVALLALASSFGLKRAPTFFLVTAGLWGYAALIDFTPPITRAAVMATVGLGAHLWQQRQNTGNSLALAALVLLLLNPAALFDPGFQFSFAATWGIIYLGVPLCRYLPLPSGFREAVTVPVAAQLAVLPFTAYYFHQTALLGMVANILVVPLAGLLVYLGLAGMVLALIVPGIMNPFFLSAGALSLPIKGLLGLLAGIPGAALLVPPPPLWLVGIWFVLLVLLGWTLREGFTVTFPHFSFRSAASRFTAPILLALVCCFLLICTGTGHGSGKLEVTFLNVGQGDSILVRTPAGRTMLIDAGGSPSYSSSSFDPGRQVVVPALAQMGIRRLDLLVNSHPHEDHLGGIPAVLDNVKVGRFASSPLEHSTPLVAQVQQQLEQKKVLVSQLHAGDTIMLDPAVKISVLGPPQTLFSGTRSDANNNSVVLYMIYGRISFLLTGDLEQEGMSELVSWVNHGEVPEGIRSSVLKAPHHGSKYSINPEFAASVRPQVVVISVGRNTFGHPDPAVIRSWEEQGARTLRTDEQGNITLITDGAKLMIK